MDSMISVENIESIDHNFPQLFILYNQELHIDLDKQVYSIKNIEI
jgi:hypothetical protein